MAYTHTCWQTYIVTIYARMHIYMTTCNSRKHLRTIYMCWQTYIVTTYVSKYTPQIYTHTCVELHWHSFWRVMNENVVIKCRILWNSYCYQRWAAQLEAMLTSPISAITAAVFFYMEITQGGVDALMNRFTSYYRLGKPLQSKSM